MSVHDYYNTNAMTGFGDLFSADNLGFKQANFDVAGAPGAGGGSKNGFSLGEWTKLGTGVANAYLGYQNLKLGRDQFDFSKSSFNTNLANQAKLINSQIEDRYRARQQFEGGSTLQADLDAYTESRKVSGKAI